MGRRVAIFAALATVALALWLATATRDEGDARLSGADRVERPHVARALHGSPVADAREAHPDATATVVAVRAEGEVLISASRDDLPLLMDLACVVMGLGIFNANAAVPQVPR